MTYAQIRGKIGSAFVMALSVLFAASAQAFIWPNAMLHPRVILNADQEIDAIANQHPDWFEKDFLIAGLYINNVVYGQSDDAIRTFFNMREGFLARKIAVATYISGTTVLPEFSLTRYPANAVSLEDISVKTKYLGPWLREPVQTVVDLKDPLSRQVLKRGIQELWLHVPSPVRFVDNAAVHPGVALLQPWDSYCQNMKELRMAAENMRSNIIFNVFVRPWQMSNKDIAQLIDAVGPNNGISLPLPWSKTIKDDKNASGWAIYRYRQLLDAGLAVIVIPSDDAPEEELVAWMATWKKSTDRLYIATPYWEEPYWVQ